MNKKKKAKIIGAVAGTALAVGIGVAAAHESKKEQKRTTHYNLNNLRAHVRQQDTQWKVDAGRRRHEALKNRILRPQKFHNREADVEEFYDAVAPSSEVNGVWYSD